MVCRYPCWLHPIGSPTLPGPLRGTGWVFALAMLVLSGAAWGSVGILVVPVAIAVGLARYRALGHAMATGTVLAQTGAVFQRTSVVPVADCPRASGSSRLLSNVVSAWPLSRFRLPVGDGP